MITEQINFFEALNAYCPLNGTEWKAVQGMTRCRTYPKGFILTEEGEFSEYVYFIETGAVRAFYHNGQHEITSWMAVEGRFIWPLPDYLLHRLSKETIQLVEQSTIISISRRDLDQLKETFSVFSELQQRIMERYIVLYDLRVQLFLIPKAEDRIDAFDKAFPDLAQRMALQYIASFLGIAPATLSRIRGYFKKNKIAPIN